MYHSVDDCSDDPYNVTVTPERLRQQLSWLRSRGLRGVGVAELLDARRRGVGRGLVGLTFDDGYGDFVENALPLLKHYECSATVFVLAGRLGGDNAWDAGGPRKPLLTAQGIRAAAAAGMEIGSHGLMHVDLTLLDDAGRRAEIQRSRAQIAELYRRHGARLLLPLRQCRPAHGGSGPPRGLPLRLRRLPGPLAGVYAMPRVFVGQRDAPWRLELKRRIHPGRRHAWRAGEAAR